MGLKGFRKQGLGLRVKEFSILASGIGTLVIPTPTASDETVDLNKAWGLRKIFGCGIEGA